MISKTKLIRKAKEAMLAAIQLYNNPSILFKSENFIILSIIAWTYLLHAYLENESIDYRYFSMNGRKKIFKRTKYGNFKYWSLDDCISGEYCTIDIDEGTKANLYFLIGIRNEIEHQMTNHIDIAISAKIQANCLDFNEYLTKWFGESHDISKNISYSLQFSPLSQEQIDQIKESHDMPLNIKNFINDFDNSLDSDTYNSQNFAYRVIFTPKLVNHPGQADQAIEFIPSDSELSEKLNESYTVIKEKEKQKYSATQIVEKMQKEGFTNFRIYEHTCLWKKLDAKNPQKGYGVSVVNYWYWYDKWLDTVREFCKSEYKKH